MLVAILADVHANLTALDAVVADVASRGAVDEVWCLGDVVGYGPDPNECVARVRELSRVCLAGNHDLVCVGKVPDERFNPIAQAAARWTRGVLDRAAAAYLSSLAPATTHRDTTLAHGSPRDPVWEYLLEAEEARDNFAFFETGVCFVGHSHVPLAFVQRAATGPARRRVAAFRPTAPDRMVVRVPNGERWIVNPGSVGQPRDGDPRASYLTYDLDREEIRWHRVVYDVAATQRRMADVRLPLMLRERLAYGV